MHKSAQQLAQDKVEYDLLYKHEQIVCGNTDHPDFRQLETEVKGYEPVDPAEDIPERFQTVCKKCLEGAVRQKIVYLFKECLYDIDHSYSSFPTDVTPKVVFMSPTA